MEGPTISAVICTRNRSADALRAARSVLANTHPSFELILVDQSTDDATFAALAPLMADPRLRYLRTATAGKGRACDLGWRVARGQIVAFTDDDCSVPPDWLIQMERAFEQSPQIGLVFCTVQAAEHDPRAGYIPAFEVRQSRLHRGDGQLWHYGIRGMGAGMAIRRSALERLDGFDHRLGPGSAFMSGEDHDIAMRALLSGIWIFETNATAVTHYGFRSWGEGKGHGRRDFFSIGAVYIKPLKQGQLRGLLVLCSRPMIVGLLQPIDDILHLRKPRGFGRLFYYLEGIWAGLRAPMASATLRYTEPAA